MTTTQVATAVSEIQGINDTILGIIAAADPAVSLPAESAAAINNLLGTMVTKALAAYTAANGVVITDASIVSTLAPDPTPLTPPDVPEVPPAAEAPVEVVEAQPVTEAAPEPTTE